MRIERDQSFQRLSSLFEDAKSPVLAPDYSGSAASSIRIALRLLGYRIADGEKYDAELRSVVLKFQQDTGHRNRDGLVGPGTRRLLTAKLIDRLGDMALGQFQARSTVLEPYIFVSYKREELARISK